MNYTYMLECGDGTIYTGWTTDLARRLKEHNSGKGSKYTRARLPVKLLYSEEYPEKRMAMKREAEIKKYTRLKKLSLIER